MPVYPIPPYLRGSDPASFAEDTIIRRLPATARRAIAENSFEESTNQRLRALADDLPTGRIRPLEDVDAPDWVHWQEALQPVMGQTWLETPWLLAETYFYRRILEATGYFQPGPGWHSDPFVLQKRLALSQAGPALALALPDGLPTGSERLRRLLHLALWANQADPSLWPVEGASGGRAQGGGVDAHILVDQSDEVLAQMGSLDGGRVELILDNAGTEFSFDLLLTDALLDNHPGLQVRFQVKMHPIYVSDVTETDVGEGLRYLKQEAPDWAKPVAERLEQAQQSGQLQIATHPYWTSPRPAWEMPTDLRNELAKSVLLISKGDVNYRRWVGDAHWSYSTPLETIINPPAPLLLLRVMKSDSAAGLGIGQAEAMFQHDPEWRVNGRWGKIQFVLPEEQS